MAGEMRGHGRRAIFGLASGAGNSKSDASSKTSDAEFLGWLRTLVKFFTNFLALKQRSSQTSKRFHLRRMQIADSKNVRRTENP